MRSLPLFDTISPNLFINILLMIEFYLFDVCILIMIIAFSSRYPPWRMFGNHTLCPTLTHLHSGCMFMGKRTFARAWGRLCLNGRACVSARPGVRLCVRLNINISH